MLARARDYPQFEILQSWTLAVAPMLDDESSIILGRLVKECTPHGIRIELHAGDLGHRSRVSTHSSYRLGTDVRHDTDWKDRRHASAIARGGERDDRGCARVGLGTCRRRRRWWPECLPPRTRAARAMARSTSWPRGTLQYLLQDRPARTCAGARSCGSSWAPASIVVAAADGRADAAKLLR